uniref:Uncharacterized protein n=1 Tax=Cucumis melo TaxID=3656 RepID=A0A9I9EAV2_CUCME
MERIKLGPSDKEAYTQSLHSNTSSPKKFSVDIMNHHIFLFIGLEDQILEAGADILVTSSYQIGSAVGALSRQAFSSLTSIAYISCSYDEDEELPAVFRDFGLRPQPRSFE